jgi:hypothetical protein
MERIPLFMGYTDWRVQIQEVHKDLRDTVYKTNDNTCIRLYHIVLNYPVKPHIWLRNVSLATAYADSSARFRVPLK